MAKSRPAGDSLRGIAQIGRGQGAVWVTQKRVRERAAGRLLRLILRLGRDDCSPGGGCARRRPPGQRVKTRCRDAVHTSWHHFSTGSPNTKNKWKEI
jgi:hypothetical protein